MTRGPIAWLLRAPLLVKLTGANLVVFACAIASSALFWDAASAVQIAAPLAVSFAVTSALIWLALRPVVTLQEAAGRVADGDWSARATPSPFADRNLSRLSETLNRLLDRAEADRAQIQYLVGRAVRARDIERETVARELRESFAQSVAGVSLMLGAIARDNRDALLGARLDEVHALVAGLGEDMRGIAELLYPGTMDEFGLLNVVRVLARRTERQGRVPVTVDGNGFRWGRISAQGAGALYRVADEVLRNVVQHARAKTVRVRLFTDETHAKLEIEDDGQGVDMRRRDPMQSGLGLFSARAVLDLAGGDLQISGAPGAGTSVIARVPHNGIPEEQRLAS